MREIKFRVFHDGEMHYLNKGNKLHLTFYSDGIPWGLYNETNRIVTGDPNAIFNTPGILMQFTGLQALYKKKHLDFDIYELDIFRHENDESKEVYSVVMWIEQRAAFYMVPVEHYQVIRDNDVSKEKEFGWLFDDASLGDFSLDCIGTKVGDIYNNPELLNL